MITVSNILDPDQAQHFVRPDLSPNCLQRLSADDTNRERVKSGSMMGPDILVIPQNVSVLLRVPVQICPYQLPKSLSPLFSHYWY